MKLWDGGDKDPCDNQIFLLVCISERCRKLAVGQCEQSDPRGGWGGQSEASESSFNLCQGLAVCQCEPSDPRGRGGREPMN